MHTKRDYMSDATTVRIPPATFFQAVFGSSQGYVCVAVKKKSKEFQEAFLRYPEQLADLHQFVERGKYNGNVYFCPQLFSEPRRVKDNVSVATCTWADLDTCSPELMLVEPTIALETSPGRYQAFWIFEEPVDPTESEDLARRIAYRHSDEGADRSGWDLTQLLRVPGTRNFKYGDGPAAPEVTVLQVSNAKYRLSDFDEYPAAEGYEYAAIPMPEFVVEDGIKILERNGYRISGAAHTLFHRPPEGDRSAQLFRLEMLCAEAGMEPTETFQVARDAACNKWDDQPHLLWRDVCRAYSVHAKNSEARRVEPASGEVDLLTDEERANVERNPCFVERYIEWGKTLGDAAAQYHEAGAFILLSSLLAGSVQLPTSFGPIIPNIWVMILADTTLSRKTTAMNTAMGLLEDIDESIMMATDGSIEGFAQALADRSGKVSIFFRDEFTGLLESMTKKDYMAGMPEFFTNLYDGRTQIRRLRREEIRIKDPRLIILAGGIKSRMQSLVTLEHVSSGFLPRFIFVTAITDVTRVKPLGPPTEQNWGARDLILNELRDIHGRYKAQVPMVVGDKVVGMADNKIDATLTQDAWKRFNQIDQTLMSMGVDSGDLRDVLTPLYARLGFSMLKSAILISAARSTTGAIVVEEQDIVRAAYYGESWRQYAREVVANIGRGPLEHKIELVAQAIHRRSLVSRSAIMQRYHLTAQEMSLIVRTLEERGQVSVSHHGRQQMLRSQITEAEKAL